MSKMIMKAIQSKSSSARCMLRSVAGNNNSCYYSSSLLPSTTKKGFNSNMPPHSSSFLLYSSSSSSNALLLSVSRRWLSTSSSSPSSLIDAISHDNGDVKRAASKNDESDSDSDSSSSSSSDSSDHDTAGDPVSKKRAKQATKKSKKAIGYSPDTLYMIDLAKMSKKDLLKRCEELEISGCKSKSKGKIIELIFQKNVDYNLELLFNSGRVHKGDGNDDEKGTGIALDKSAATATTSSLPNNNDDNDNDNKGDSPVVDTDEQLDDHWKMMERRLLRRKSVPKGPDTKDGRGAVRPSAWDHEHV